MDRLNGLDWSIITVVGGLALCAIAVFFYLQKVRGGAYEGVIESKGSGRKEFDDGTSATVYFVMVKLADGKQKRVHLSEKLWKEWEVGQAIAKRKGRMYPEPV